jgi:hypothetical protein
MHARVRKMIGLSGVWRNEEWGAPINQHDMVATSLLFSSVTIDGLRALGAQVSRDESDAFMHLWRWIGQLMGVDPALAPGTEAEAHALSELIAATQGPPDDDSRALTTALLEHGLVHTDLEERDRAAKTLGLGRAICRHLLGKEIADALGVPKTRERFVLPAAIAAIRAFEQARVRSPRLEAKMIERGERYWAEVLKRGLFHATTDFTLPERLGALRG